MNKIDIIREAAIRAGTSQHVARSVLDAATDLMTETLLAKGEIAMYGGLGKLEIRLRAKRTNARNMVTGDKVVIPARNYVYYRASAPLLAAARKRKK